MAGTMLQSTVDHKDHQILPSPDLFPSWEIRWMRVIGDLASLPRQRVSYKERKKDRRTPPPKKKNPGRELKTETDQPLGTTR